MAKQHSNLIGDLAPTERRQRFRWLLAQVQCRAILRQLLRLAATLRQKLAALWAAQKRDYRRLGGPGWLLTRAWPVALTATLLGQPLIARADEPRPTVEFRVNTTTEFAQRDPSVAMDSDGDVVVVWAGNGPGDTSGIFAQRYDAANQPVGSEFRINTYITGGQGNPSVGVDAAGNFVVAWNSFGSGGSDVDGSIQARRFAANGAPLDASEFQVNTYTTNSQNTPRVAVDQDGDFVVAWQSLGSGGSDTDGNSIQARRFAANGTPLDASEFQVNTYTTSFQNNRSVAVDRDGDFVIAWESAGSDGTDTDGFSVQARRYAANGVPLDASEFQVNTYTTSSQGNPSLAFDADGNFVVAWNSGGSSGTDTDASSVQARRYAASGVPVDASEFQVNTYITTSQRAPSVAVDQDGDFVVAWQSGSYFISQDGSSDGIYAQRYSADGTPQGSEFQVNTYITTAQRAPSVAARDADGDFVIAWQSGGYSGSQDGSTYGVYARRYSLPQLALSKTASPTSVDPGQTLTYTLTIANGGFISASNALISDTLPSDLNFVGPIRLEPLGVDLPNMPPLIADGLTITDGDTITLTFPVTVSQDVNRGTDITNTAAVSSSEVSTPITGLVKITIAGQEIYLPVVLKNN